MGLFDGYDGYDPSKASLLDFSNNTSSNFDFMKKPTFAWGNLLKKNSPSIMDTSEIDNLSKDIGKGIPKPTTDWFSMNKAFGKYGWAPTATQAGLGLVSALLGWQGLQQQKEDRKVAIDQFNRQFGAQANMYNTKLADNYQSKLNQYRSDEKPTTMLSLDEYMKANRIA